MMATEYPKPLPCPLCGAEMFPYAEEDSEWLHTAEEPGQPKCPLADFELPDTVEAIAAWNHRPFEVEARKAGRNEALADAAKVVGDHDRQGREWAPASFWGSVTREAVRRIEALTAPSGPKP